MVDIAFLLVYIFLPDLFTPVSLTYLLSAHCILNILLYFRQRSKEFVNPIFLFYVSVIMVNYANLTLINEYETGNLRPGNFLVPQFIDEAVRLWCIGSTFMIIGYNFFSKKSLPSIAMEINSKKAFRILFWALLLINLQRTFSIGPALPLGSNFKLVNIFSILFFARLWTKENSKTYRNYAIILYVLITYNALMTAFLRFDLILPTVSLFAGYFIGLGNVKYVFTYRVVPFLIIIGIYASVFKALQANRSNFYSVIFNNNDKAAVISNIRDNEQAGTGLVERTSNLAQLTSVMRLVKQNGFYDGKVSEPLVAALVPRFLWPDKPIVALGSWFATELIGGHLGRGERVNNSINMMICGELYLDFGWLGVAIGCLLTGWFFSVLWNATQFYSSQYNLTGIIFGGYLLIVSLSSFGADLQIVLTLTSLYLSILVIKRVIKVPQR